MLRKHRTYCRCANIFGLRQFKYRFRARSWFGAMSTPGKRPRIGEGVDTPDKPEWDLNKVSDCGEILESQFPAEIEAAKLIIPHMGE